MREALARRRGWCCRLAGCGRATRLLLLAVLAAWLACGPAPSSCPSALAAGTRFWNPPRQPEFQTLSVALGQPHPVRLAELQQLRQRYARGPEWRTAASLALGYSWLAMRDEYESGGCAAEYHYLASAFSWATARQPDCPASARGAASEHYRRSLARLLITAQQSGRYRPGEGLCLWLDGAWRTLPVVLQGFRWSPADFQELHPVGDYESELLTNHYQQPGGGLPLVVRRVGPTGQYRESYFLDNEPKTFAASALLVPDLSALLPEADWSRHSARLVLRSPWDGLADGLQRPIEAGVPLAMDVSAPLAYQAIHQPASPRLVKPTTSDAGPSGSPAEGTPDAQDRLFFLEPYQPGKIPVVFVHGLLSSPQTWIDPVNELQAIPGIHERFQFWGFRYDTGRPFLGAAARLRDDLQLAYGTLDPEGRDLALQHTILIGHSMGGLVAKLQVVESGERLWQAVASKPLDQLVVDQPTRQLLVRAFHFSPQPFVRRVVYLGTPHSGSPWAQRAPGQLASLLVTVDPDRRRQHARLLADNPGAFSPEFARRFPTSFDLLQPDSPLLCAIHQLAPASGVRTHSVIGTGRPMLLVGPADGVVPAASAWLRSANSTVLAPETHSYVHRGPTAANELHRLLLAEAWELHRRARLLRDGSHPRHPPPSRPAPQVPGPSLSNRWRGPEGAGG